MGRRILLLTALSGLLFLCLACDAASESPTMVNVGWDELDGENGQLPADAAENGDLAYYPEDGAKLSITRGSGEFGQHILIYPYILGNYDAQENPYDSINTIVYDRLTDGLTSYAEAQVSKYRIKCNSAGVLSVMLELGNLRDAEVTLLLPMTFDAQSKAALRVCDLFDSENDRWRALIPDIITVQAEKNGLVLINEVMPIADDQLFYLTEKSIVFVYRPYEITTYTVAWPEFSIPIQQLTDFFTEASPLHRLVEYGEQAAGPMFYVEGDAPELIYEAMP